MIETEWLNYLYKNPIFGLILAGIVSNLIYQIVKYFYYIVIRFFRLLHVIFRGYPPPYCDADGDYIKPKIKIIRRKREK